MIRHAAKSLALRVPPIRQLYQTALHARAENTALKQRVKELTQSKKNLEKVIHGSQNVSRADRLRELLECLEERNLQQGAAAVRAVLETNAQSLDRDGAIRDMLTFIAGNCWENIAEYKVAGSLIESLAAAPVAPDVAGSLESMRPNLLCLRGQPASHYSLIFLQRNPITGEPFDGSFSPMGLISVEEKNELAALAEEAAVDGMKVAEIGCFTGRGSTPLLAEIVRKYRGSMVCIDNFPDIGDFSNLRDLFEGSATALGFRNLVTAIDGNSHHIAAQFPDGYFDLIYVDGGHTFDALDGDIKAWRPKVRSGGILCGHDCIRTASGLTAEQLADMEDVRNSGARVIEDPRHPGCFAYEHPGVIAAVAKNFGTDVRVAASPCGVWSHRT